MHGGYFAPTGFLKVEAGGSHEENPNGGVQIGVDPQGVPNMLEEGEPLYNDYVYSDNIYADSDILEKHNLPKNLAGKLYSDIAEKFIDTDRPLDAIAGNGMEVMLTRLADAQEEQKAIEQQKELEKALAQMTPEEIEEIGAMLEEQAVAEQQAMPVQPEMVPQEQMMAPEEQVIPEEQMMQEQPMMMKYGGTLLRKYDIGGPVDVDTLIENAKKDAAAEAVRRQLMQEYNNASRDYGYSNFFGRKLSRYDEAIDNQRKALIAASRDFANGEYSSPDAFEKEVKARAAQIDKLSEKRNKREAKLNSLQEAKNAAVEKLNSFFGNAPYGTPAGTTINPGNPSVVNSAPSGRKYSTFTFNAKEYGGPVNRYDGLQWNQPSWLTRAIPGVKPNDSLDLNTSTGPLYDFKTSLDKPVSESGWRPKDSELLGWNQPVFRPLYGNESETKAAGVPNYSTMGEWVGPALDLGQMLWDMPMEGDRYPMERIRAQRAEGRLNLQNPRFQAIDINQTENRNIAQNNATISALRNAGLGPSTAAAILAADYRGGLSRGLGFLQDWQTNNQAYNNTIAQINANAAAQAQFDAQLDQAYQAARQQAQQANVQNDLLRRRLEYSSDQDVANAFITSARDLANYAWAKAAYNRDLNRANSNRAFYDYAFPGGQYAYRSAACGGHIKKTK